MRFFRIDGRTMIQQRTHGCDATEAAAVISGVVPSVSGTLASPPALSRVSMSSASPVTLASDNGVTPSTRVARSVRARFQELRTAARSSRDAAS